jgi:hypothetical protein
VDEDDRVIDPDTFSQPNGFACDPGDLPNFEPGGDRRSIYQPSRALAAR